MPTDLANKSYVQAHQKVNHHGLGVVKVLASQKEKRAQAMRQVENKVILKLQSSSNITFVKGLQVVENAESPQCRKVKTSYINHSCKSVQVGPCSTVKKREMSQLTELHQMKSLKSGGVKQSLHDRKFAYSIDDINHIENNKSAKRIKSSGKNYERSIADKSDGHSSCSDAYHSLAGETPRVAKSANDQRLQWGLSSSLDIQLLMEKVIFSLAFNYNFNCRCN